MDIRFEHLRTSTDKYLRFNDGEYQWYGPIDEISHEDGVKLVITLRWLARAALNAEGAPTQPWQAMPLQPFTIPHIRVDTSGIIDRTPLSLNPEDIVGLVLDKEGRQIAPV